MNRADRQPRATAGPLLFCQPTLNRSGSEKSLLETLKNLRGERRSVLVLAGQAGPMAEEYTPLIRKLHVVPRNEVSGRRRIAQFLLSFWRVAREITLLHRRQAVSLAYVNTLMFPQAIVGAFLNRIPVICHVREVPERYPRVLYAFLLGIAALLASRIVLVSGKVFGNRWLPFRKCVDAKSRVLYNTSSFPAGPRNHRVNGTYRILCVVPVVRAKGVEDIVEVSRGLHSRCPNGFHIDVVGRIIDTGLFEDLRNALERAGLENHVTFHGEAADVAPYFLAAHVLLHPSRAEALPRVLIEACNFSLPTVATRVGGAEDVVTHGETGVLVDCGDTDGMAQSLEVLARDPETYARFANNAYRRYRKLFSPEATRGILQDILDLNCEH